MNFHMNSISRNESKSRKRILASFASLYQLLDYNSDKCGKKKKKKNTNVSCQTTNQEIPFPEITSSIGDQQSVERSKDLQQVDMLE